MKQVSEHIKQILGQLPEKTGVYQYFNAEGKIIYVGKAVNLKRRVSSYFHHEHEWAKTRQLVAHIADIKYVVVETEQDALLLENNLIKQYQPHYNILLKDGKSYPSICITKEPYPRIFKTRNIDKKVGEYYGPYSYGNTVDLVIDLLHKLYPIRTCTTPLNEESIAQHRHRVCLKYHLMTCCGVCENKVSYNQYTQYIADAKKIIRGDAHLVLQMLDNKMKQYAQEYRYEEAQNIKEKIELIEKFRSKTIITHTDIAELDVFGYDEQDQNVYVSILHVHNGSIVQGQTIEYRKQLDETKEELLGIAMMELRERLGSTSCDVLVPFIPDGYSETMRMHISVSGDKKKLLELAERNVHQYKADRLKQQDKLNPEQRATRILNKLKQMLNLERIPLFIDSFDNSNVQGVDAVAGCVVFRHAKPSKKDYKRFRIKSISGADDYASMREIVRRRYMDIIDEHGEFPDLIIADGGAGQMKAIHEVVEQQLQLHIPIAGLKKDDKHHTKVLLYGWPPQEVGMKVTDEVFRLMVQIQDEVHRFAITYHKLQRSKRQTKSELDDIQGVGPIYKQKILQHFHSVKQASLAEKQEWIDLLGTSLGSTCYEYFQNKIT